jgi:error-prone DNA polymerase
VPWSAFLAALINSTHGFYSPSQLVQDAQRHKRAGQGGGRDAQRVGLHWKPPQRRAPGRNRLIFGIRPGQPAIRLGLRLVASLSESTVHRILAARQQTPFANTGPGAARQLDRTDINALAAC